MTQATVVETNFSGLKPIGRGKVRDIYEVDGKLLLVASDRLSAFDVVLPDGIPGKGKVLTQISAFWFRMLEDIVPNHMISVDVEAFPEAARPHCGNAARALHAVPEGGGVPGRVRRPGYLSGSGWAEYRQSGEVCGIPLPKGLKESDRLPEPDLHPLDQGGEGEARREHLLRADGGDRGAGDGRKGALHRRGPV